MENITILIILISMTMSSAVSTFALWRCFKLQTKLHTVEKESLERDIETTEQLTKSFEMHDSCARCIELLKEMIGVILIEKDGEEKLDTEDEHA